MNFKRIINAGLTKSSDFSSRADGEETVTFNINSELSREIQQGQCTTELESGLTAADTI